MDETSATSAHSSLEWKVQGGEQIERLKGQPADAEHEDDNEEHLGHFLLLGQDDLISLLVGLAWRLHPPETLMCSRKSIISSEK